MGCDSAHSLVRKQAGIGFPGTTSPEISRIGQVRLPTAKLTWRGGVVKVPGIGRLKLMGQVRTPRGIYSLAPLTVLDKNATAGVFIVYTSEDDPTADLSAPITVDELRASARRVLGGDLPMTDPQRLSRLVGNSRQADRYQAGRILLAGDAAHVFAVSLNTGLIDAVNLGWKLAAKVQGRAPDGLMESYHAERHLAGQHAILQARAQKALTIIGQGGTDELAKVSPEGAEALRELFGDVLEHPEPLQHIRELLREPMQLRHIGELIEGSDVRYPMPASNAQPHPLVGKLAPDLQLENPSRPHPGRRVHARGPGRPARPHRRFRSRRGGPRPGRPDHRHHRTLPDRARSGRSAANPARRPRRLGCRTRHARPGRRDEHGPAYLVQPAHASPDTALASAGPQTPGRRAE